jgi:tRNA(Ile)-lysidine synthase
MDMLETITSYIERHHLLPKAGEIVVAVSGGADSLCLLHLLHRLCGPGKRYPGLRLRVAHLNHKLRGEAGIQDAATVARIAAAWGLPVTVGEVDVPALAHQERRSLEDAARAARYCFLREVAQGQLIAVAHHAGDQVETLLLHWLRGAGLAGMVGMLPCQQNIIRPLLEVSHAETVAYCRLHDIVPVEDASNTDPHFLRNRIRHELLPLLESLNPGIRATLLRAAGVMGVDAGWIEEQVDACWPGVVLTEHDTGIRLSLSALLVLPLSIQRHLLRRVTARLCAGQSPLELRHYMLIEDLLHRKNSRERLVLDLPHQLLVVREADQVMFERLQADVTKQPLSAQEENSLALLPIPGRTPVPGTSWLAVAETLPNELLQEVRSALSREDWSAVWQLLPPTSYVVYVDADVTGSSLEVRARRPGDRIQPLGMAHEKKVQDVLVDKHIARADRSRIPLFLSASHSVWLAGICLDDRVRLTHRTRYILRLSITTA